MARNGGAFTWAATNARLALDQRPVAHFLHIGKAAGTAVTFGLKQAPGIAKYRLIRHPHNIGLPNIPESDYYFFCVRDPIDRYASGFLHRELQGQPRFSVPWPTPGPRWYAKQVGSHPAPVSRGPGRMDSMSLSRNWCGIGPYQALTKRPRSLGIRNSLR